VWQIPVDFPQQEYAELQTNPHQSVHEKRQAEEKTEKHTRWLKG
jgi:hypothetical protein